MRVNGVSTVWGRLLASVLTASSERTTVVLLKVSQLVNSVFSRVSSSFKIQCISFFYACTREAKNSSNPLSPHVKASRVTYWV